MVMYLLRHGDAAQHPHLHDSDRPLSGLGQHQADAAARVLRSVSPPVEAIFTSPLLRARETAEPIHNAFPGAPVRTTEHLVPGSDLRQLFALLDGLSARAVLLVGHEPLMSNLTSLCIAGDGGSSVRFEKATLACIDMGEPVSPGSGELLWLLPSELLTGRDGS